MEQIAAAMETPPSNHRETDQLPARPRKGGLRTMPFIIGNNKHTDTDTDSTVDHHDQFSFHCH
jgi:hypothetical protein